MKRLLISLGIAMAVAPALQADVGVSITVGEPGFYGHIDIGDFPEPRLVYREPIIVERITVSPHPVYLHVPPGHIKHWDQHCHNYGACAQRVYFVEDAWYENVYVQEYRKKHGNKGKGNKSKNKRNK
ncbi:MAG TPA: hypothetical protein VKN35_12355 [Xanthomonadales bacterium]|nr:hypothetical protein [Xanthomonadales bacterium]